MGTVASPSYVQVVAGDGSAPIDIPFAEAEDDIEEESSEGHELLSRIIEAQTRNCEIDPIKESPKEEFARGVIPQLCWITDQREHKRN